MRRSICACLLLLAGFTPRAAVAQETGSVVDKVTDWVDSHHILEWLKGRPDNVEGFWIRPRIGGITPGAGFAFGPEVIWPIVPHWLEVQARGALSTKRYRFGKAELVSPRLLDNHLELAGGLTYQYFPEEDFWGIGGDSAGPRTNYLFQNRDYHARARFKIVGRTSVGVIGGYMQGTVASGRDRRYSSTERVFTPTSTPGLTGFPDLRYATAFFDIDTRDNPDLVHRGTRVYAATSRYLDDTLHRFSFKTVEAQALQLVPFSDRSRLLFFGRAVTTDPVRGQHVPFYLMPRLGGDDSLRGYETFRFRDRSLAQVNAEFQQQVFDFLDAALFADAGDVAPRLRDISLTDFKTAYGVGLRFHTQKMMIFRVDAALAGTGARRVLVRLQAPF